MLSLRIFSLNKYAAIQAFYGSLPTQGRQIGFLT
jgi:hypothetical protein